jgi:hypothetical protein
VVSWNPPADSVLSPHSSTRLLPSPPHGCLWVSASVSVSCSMKPLRRQWCWAPVCKHSRVSFLVSKFDSHLGGVSCWAVHWLALTWEGSRAGPVIGWPFPRYPCFIFIPVQILGWRFCGWVDVSPPFTGSPSWLQEVATSVSISLAGRSFSYIIPIDSLEPLPSLVSS